MFTEGDAALASRPVFHRRDARAVGLSDEQIRYRLGTTWREILPRVYTHTAAALSAEHMRRAALIWGGDGAALSHGSAATLWRLDGTSDGAPEIVIPRRRNLRSKIVIVHRADLAEHDASMHKHLRVTTLPRTIVDLAAVLPGEELERAIESARRLHGMSLAAVRSCLGPRAPGVDGATALRRLLDVLDGSVACESVLEVKLARLLRASHFPPPVRQHWVHTIGGRYRLDFAWPERRVALECDGRAFHEFQRDRTRWRHLGAAGRRVLTVTWDDVTTRGQKVLAEVAAACDAHQVRVAIS